MFQTLFRIQSKAYTNIFNEKVKAHACAQTNLRQLEEFKVSDSVMFYSNCGYGRKSKLSTLWQGPMEVVEKNDKFSYMLKDNKNSLLVSKVHAKYMYRVLL